MRGADYSQRGRVQWCGACPFVNWCDGDGDGDGNGDGGSSGSIDASSTVLMHLNCRYCTDCVCPRRVTCREFR